MLEVLAPVRNQKGVSLVVILVATGILGIGFFAMTNGLFSVLSLRGTLNSNFNVSQTRANIIGTLSTGNALARTVSANSVMSCVTPGAFTDCAPQKASEHPVKVVDASGNVLTDPTQPSFGFRDDGTSCNTFNAAAGNDACPYRFDVTWRPICPGGGLPCINPQSRFTGTLTYKPVTKKSFVMNLSKYNFQIYPAKMDSTLEASCKAIDGVFNTSNGNCILPMAGLCPPNQVVVYVDNANHKYCNYLIRGVCAPGQAITFVDINGNVTCKPILSCPPTSGPSRTKYSTWLPWEANAGGDGGDGGDGCDGTDGCDGGGGS